MCQQLDYDFLNIHEVGTGIHTNGNSAGMRSETMRRGIPTCRIPTTYARPDFVLKMRAPLCCLTTQRALEFAHCGDLKKCGPWWNRVRRSRLPRFDQSQLID